MVFAKISRDLMAQKYSHAPILTREVELGLVSRQRLYDPYYPSHILNTNKTEEMLKQFGDSKSPGLKPYLLKNILSKIFTFIYLEPKRGKKKPAPKREDSLEQFRKEHQMSNSSKRKTNSQLKDIDNYGEEDSHCQERFSMIQPRKSALHRNISFETTVHNIYDPEFSSPSQSFCEDQDEVTAYLSSDSIILEKPYEIDPKNNMVQEQDSLPKRNTDNLNDNKESREAYNQVGVSPLDQVKEQFLELLFKSDNNDSNYYSKYLNSNKNQQDTSINSVNQRENQKLRDYNENIFKDLIASSDYKSNKGEYNLTPSDLQNKRDKKFESPSKPIDSDLKNDSFLRSLNLGSQVRDQVYNFLKKSDAKSPIGDYSQNDHHSPFVQLVNHELKKGKREKDEEAHETYYNGLIGKKGDSNTGSKNLDRVRDIPAEDFIMKTMSSLETLKNKLADSNNVSKNNETMKSMDLTASPDLGKTKDTSLFSGNKRANIVSTSRSNVSDINSSVTTGIANKLGINSDSLFKYMNKTHTLHSDTKGGDYSSKSCYFDEHKDIISFADRIEAIHNREVRLKKNISHQNPSKQMNKVPSIASLMKCHSMRSMYKESSSSRKEYSEALSAKVNTKGKVNRDPSSSSNYSKQTFSSMCYSKGRPRIGSENASVITDFSTKRLKRICSSRKQTKPAKNKTKIVNKKGSTGRNASAKKAKQFVKNVKYASPVRLVTQNDYCKSQNNLNNFRKQYLNKRSWNSKGSGCDSKVKKSKKSLSKKKKPIQSVKKFGLPGQNIKMKTINLGESRNFEDISAKSGNSYKFNIHDAKKGEMKKSPTEGSLQLGPSPVFANKNVNEGIGMLNLYN